MADRTEHSSANALGIVDALLAFARATHRADSGDSAPLRPAVTKVLEELAPLVERLDVAIGADDLPDLSVRCTPGLLHILLANLCGNAVKFLEGQPVRRVTLSVRELDAWCQLDIADTGPGIPRSLLEKIFDPFVRVPGRLAPGTGIGLATVRRIVEACGGRVTAESDEGHGATFHVWLPLAPADHEPRPASAPPLHERDHRIGP
jgi:signal transduction histidine kinase